MYEPAFNSVLVEIDDKDAEWGSGNDESMLGASYSKGTVVKLGDLAADDKYNIATLEMVASDLAKLKSKQIIWNEGAEAGTIFEHNGKKYGFIYWYDIRGQKAAK